ncbi:cellulose binding domain-containing protein [Plantactinospora sp. KLBMP9567]|uniref:cellulose binding domain-containing protein n=1 Tax=Plantactinospora sp. KLBMP9567 TaxID=3085900 RepID=UPI00298170AB|nr:cellulose binding domain-containing protein [Plantactinospora sp. KLBMP9567]MDW5324312.1 cellulose binding domain-containing protein [Plantactinospora sp. KLBMP9567]
MRNRPSGVARWLRILLVPALAAVLTAASGTVGYAAAEPAPACGVRYQVSGAFPPAMQAQLIISNLGQAQINGWTLRFSFPDKQPLYFFGAELVSRDADIVTTRDLGYNAVVPPNGSVTIGYLTIIPAPTPTNFAVNGAPCQAG